MRNRPGHLITINQLHLTLATMATNRIFSVFGRSVKSPFVRDFAYYSFAFATWVPALIFFNNHVAKLGYIDGSSMYPYFNTAFNESLKNDLCVIKKWNPINNLQRGMIVSFR